jgi:excisionase family DNA binding protein
MRRVHEEYFTLEEVAKKLKMGRRTVSRWVESGKMKAVKFSLRPGHIRVTETDLKEFIDKYRTHSGE